MRSLPTWPWSWSTTVALVLALGACNGGEIRCSDGGACSGGSSSAQVVPQDGLASTCLSGMACQCLVGADWSLGLVDPRGVDSTVIGREAGGRLGVSPPAHPLRAVASGATDLGPRARRSLLGNAWTCSTGSDGTLDVPASSDPSVDGSISVGLLGSLSGGQATSVLLQGTFQAVNGPVTLIR